MAVFLTQHECRDNFWHVVTYDVSDPDNWIEIEDLSTSQSCEATPNIVAITRTIPLHRQDERLRHPIRMIATISGFLGSVSILIASLTLLWWTLSNLTGFYEIELAALRTIVAATSGIADISMAVLATAWILIVICVVAFLVVVGGTLVIFFTGFVQWLIGEIRRLSALCPTLTWPQSTFCYAALTGAIALFTALTGLYFTSIVVVVINILVVLLG